MRYCCDVTTPVGILLRPADAITLLHPVRVPRVGMESICIGHASPMIGARLMLAPVVYHGSLGVAGFLVVSSSVGHHVDMLNQISSHT